MLPKKKKIISCIAVFAILVLAVIVVAAYFSSQDPFFRPTRFAQEQWMQGDIRIRGQMVHDLIQKELIDGKTRPQLITLLGEPDFVSKASISYTVDIGQRFGYEVWTYQLSIRLDETETVTDYCLHD